MTTKQLQKLAKEKYGRKITDEMAADFLKKNKVSTEEELDNVVARMNGSGPNDPTPTNLSGTIRYFRLANKAGFVAQMKLKWVHYTQVEEGNVILKKIDKSGSYELSGYRDVCLGAERTIDMNDTDIPDGSEVYLEVIVCAGYDRKAGEIFIYSSTAGDRASYEISGATLTSKLKKV